MTTATLTAARLRQLLDYDPDTGIFIWRVTRGLAKAGAIAGFPRVKGYRSIGVDGEHHRAHRLAWLYITGSWPAGQIDHRDTDKTNNRFVNLRVGSQSFNLENRRRAMKSNKLGLLGVCAYRDGFHAQIQVQGKKKHLGYFAEAEAAHAAYLAAKRAFHPGSTL